jgi:hypothetical protein
MRLDIVECGLLCGVLVVDKDEEPLLDIPIYDVRVGATCGGVAGVDAAGTVGGCRC